MLVNSGSEEISVCGEDSNVKMEVDCHNKTSDNAKSNDIKVKDEMRFDSLQNKETDKPYSCDHCIQSFELRSDRAKHMRSHQPFPPVSGSVTAPAYTTQMASSQGSNTSMYPQYPSALPAGYTVPGYPPGVLPPPSSTQPPSQWPHAQLQNWFCM